MEPRIRAWWRGETGWPGRLLHTLLAPAEWTYRGVVVVRNAGYERGWLRMRSAGLPVVSVGNLTVGGAGKTPVSAWIAGFLAARGERPALGLRGYGTDEIRLHQRMNPGVPVLAGARRIELARRAEADGRSVLVLDDAFQHRRLRRALDVVLVTAEEGIGAARLLPRGPWREPPRALRRADLVVITRKVARRERADGVRAEVARLAPGVPTAAVWLAPLDLAPLRAEEETVGLGWLAGRQVLALTSIARPEAFLEQLRAAGARVEGLVYPDHHPFSEDDLLRIEARRGDLPLVTTEKDAVKLIGRYPVPGAVRILRQEVRWEAGRERLEGMLPGRSGRTMEEGG